MSQCEDFEKKTHKRVLEIVKQIEKENNAKYNCNEVFSPRDISCIEIGYVYGCIDCKEKLSSLMSEHGVSDNTAQKIIESVFD
jgi:hypothetical protein